MARSNKNGTELDLIAICEKKDTIKYSTKIDNFCQIAELCELKSSKNSLSRQWEIKFLCLFAMQDEFTGEKS